MLTYKSKYIIACFYFRKTKIVCFNIVDFVTRSLHFEFSYPHPADKDRAQTDNLLAQMTNIFSWDIPQKQEMSFWP